MLILALLACTRASPDTGADTGAGRLLRFDGAAPTNVLVLSMDTLTRSGVGRYSGADTSPTLDRLMASGVSFDNHRSCSSWTYASVACTMSGAPNEDMGYVPHIIAGAELSDMETMPDSVDLLPEVFAGAGFDTRLFSSNPYLSADFNTAQGYDSSAFTANISASNLTSEVIADTQDLQAPFLLHAHYIDPHSPFQAPAAYTADALAALPDVPWDLSTEAGDAQLRAAWLNLTEQEQQDALAHLAVLYDGEIRFMDDQIAVLLADLEQRGLLDGTLVVGWTDHGEQFFEHDALGHGMDLYSEENDAIAFYSGAGIIPVAYPGPTTHIDFGPTLLAAMGLDVPGSMTGRVLMSNSQDVPRYSLNWPKDGAPHSSVEDGDWKLIYTWNGMKELYHRSVDPGEQVELSTSEPEQLDALWALLKPTVEKQALVLDVVPVL